MLNIYIYKKNIHTKIFSLKKKIMTNLHKLKIFDNNILDIYLIIIYSLLPISLILGNLFINVNILIIGISLIIYSYTNL